jgi:hypothetical protein
LFSRAHFRATTPSARSTLVFIPDAVRRLTAASCLALLASCSSGSDSTEPPPPPPPAVASLQLTVANGSLQAGQTTQATAVLKDASGAVLTGRTVTWQSSAAGVASVAGNGLTAVITAVAAGTATISASSEGQAGTATLTVCLAAITPPAAGVTTVHVSATLGSNTGTGSCAQPFRTVTQGVNGTSTGTVVRVLPGTYDAALGEVFPIMLPAGVQLIGDEANKGQGPVRTKVIGGAALALSGDCGTYGSTIYAGANAVIAGFELTNNVGTFAQMTLLIRNSGVTVRNNAIVQGGLTGIFVCNQSNNQVITGNLIRDNTSIGIGFIHGGNGAKVEQNVIVNNQYGVEYDSPGGDLGGGASGSAGGNTISCNTVNDLWTNSLLTINAANNFWDHVPFSGNDLFNGGAATIITTGGALAPNRCP